MLARKALMPLLVGIEGKIKQRETSVGVIESVLTCWLLAHGRATRLDAPHGDDAGGVGVGDKVVVRLPQGRAQVALLRSDIKLESLVV